MLRFLVSLLGGRPVIGGAWFGRTRSADVETIGSDLATFEVPTQRRSRLVSVALPGQRSDDPWVLTWGAAKAAQLVDTDGGVSHVLGVVERSGSWYAGHTEGDFEGTQPTAWKAPSGTGPWPQHRTRFAEISLP